jgi:hypothetical protein
MKYKQTPEQAAAILRAVLIGLLVLAVAGLLDALIN